MKEHEQMTIERWCNGRLLDETSLPYSKEAIDEAVEAGRLIRRPGVVKQGRSFRCMRCQNEDPMYFYTHIRSEGEEMTYCMHCLTFGRSSTDGRFVHAPRLPIERRDVRLAWDGTYTTLQRRAADEWIESIEAGRGHLLYAVTGAGKTEVMFRAVEATVQRGGRVAVVSPRVDVVRELLPRFERAFPTARLIALYGGVKPVPFAHDIVLATTHQLYRFYEAFDAVFIDEVDAFPYTADETLHRAVERSLVPSGVVHAVTATPSRALRRTYEKEGALSIIPKRFHGYPLVEPTYDALFGYERALRKGRVPRKVERWMRRCMERRVPYLLFFPSIDVMEQTEALFRTIDPRVRAVHSEHPKRAERVRALRDGKLSGLLTSTILERGVTISSVQVAVLGAEQPIFTSEALVQIGGRVGRSADDPTGDFRLFHHGITRAMDEARRAIRSLNKRGRDVE
ncbi:DNA/RNA helicase [Planococcaceae bacterium Storch 2/2-2]|nr:DNA/RNA helicase [Planococcaceae bacterium Storch 2/2-2]